ncbi:BLUF domain-containing protein [Sphingomonas solaris]|uniref:BLUF domain-containing protein n=1 Tax=Alterirhizorhabdus solaris TaxID=2529389 RepID=A0A558RC25_9SPHN|nr:BLUF domain-containing protein [Sphingomonas solaris]TVV76969.1 BLUF domain-containing protein [Sphingomonas solaris]
MIQLLYISTSSRPVTPVIIDGICVQARHLNQRHEITGVLLCRRDMFLQALEGPQLAIEDTFLRLINDPRHHAVTVLSRRKVTRRTFGGLQLRYCAPRENCPEVYEDIETILEGASQIAASLFAAFAE